MANPPPEAAGAPNEWEASIPASLGEVEKNLRRHALRLARLERIIISLRNELEESRRRENDASQEAHIQGIERQLESQESQYRQSILALRDLIDQIPSADIFDPYYSRVQKTSRRWEKTYRSIRGKSVVSLDSSRSPRVEPRTRLLPGEISVILYLDTNDEKIISQVVRNLDNLVGALGYGRPLNPEIERGSFFRQSWSKLKRSLTSDDLKEIAAKMERALEARYLDSQQVAIDNTIAGALSKLIISLSEVPSACIRSGSILLIKYPGPQGSIILTRNLSEREIKILEQFPEIQRTPHAVLESLAVAISEVLEVESQ